MRRHRNWRKENLKHQRSMKSSLKGVKLVLHEDDFSAKELEILKKRSASLTMYYVVYSIGDRISDEDHDRNEESINCGKLLLI